jgi:hypothetical protein
MSLSSWLVETAPVLSDQIADATDRAIRTAVQMRGPAIAAAGDQLRAASPRADPARIVDAAVARKAWTLAGTGAVSALPAVLPGPGTVAEIGAALGDISLLTAAHVEIVLLAAHLYGRPLSDHEGRRLDVLMVLGLDTGVVKLKRGGRVEALGAVHGADDLRGTAVDGLATRISARLAIQVTARLARRKAHIILGREIPVLGIGLAATYNLRSTRNLGDSAVRYYRHIA